MQDSPYDTDPAVYSQLTENFFVKLITFFQNFIIYVSGSNNGVMLVFCALILTTLMKTHKL